MVSPAQKIASRPLCFLVQVDVGVQAEHPHPAVSAVLQSCIVIQQQLVDGHVPHWPEVQHRALVRVMQIASSTWQAWVMASVMHLHGRPCCSILPP